MAESKYKCLLISEQTTARDVIKLLFHCYGLEPEPCSSSPNSGSSPGNSVGPGLVPAGIISSSPEVVDKYCLYEHIPPVQRKLEAEEYPVYVQSQWNQPEKSRLVLRLVEEIEVDAVFARPARIIEVEDHCQLGQDDSMLMHLDTSYCSSGESTASSEFSALRFRDSPMSASSRSNASTDSGLKSSVPVPSSEEEQHRQQQHNHLHHSQHTHCDSGSSHVLKPGGVDDRLHHPLFKKNSTIITCTHHKGMRCAQMTLTRHYSLSSLLEALPAASVDAEADLEKHASISSLSSGSRYSDYDGYFYI